MFLREPRKRTILISVCGRFKTGWKGAEHWSNMENTNERLIWENQHHSSTMFMWAALKEDAKLARILWIITEVCSNVTWKVMQRNASHLVALAKETCRANGM